MAEFQVRVASEVIYYFEELKKVYGTNIDTEITRSQILTRAFEETKSISNWTPIIEDVNTIPLTNLEYISGSGTNIKAQISDDTEKGIRNLKYLFPSFTNTRSVTLGVTVKYMLKGALILNKTGQVSLDKSGSLDYQFEIFESKLKNIVAPINHEMLINLLNDFKNKINL
ncbi:hypothetical protein IGL16_002306 [Enterococcus sp. AZ117]|jgi:hypothetical protein|uniref:hypothetical protein n=1 Tax=unclassified Enterococcus TaxID=2608891 RepID=UPI001A07B0CA|nr:hypothetical protein [Enterococcus faecalis]EGO7769414.1 hypothetical protein [Enterococcus faecalis]EHB6498113.1 hypothetical protein [Enterococcus faecalis]